MEPRRTFYRCTNQGVTGVVDYDTAIRIESWRKITSSSGVRSTQKSCLILPLPPHPGPIFTFASGLAARDKSQFLTGNLQLMDALLTGHNVVTMWQFYVPFSNGKELRTDEEGELERSYRTSLAQAIETFGLITPSRVNDLIRATSKR